MLSSDFGPGLRGCGRPFGATDDSEDRRCLMVHVCEHKYRCLQRQPSMFLAESCSQSLCQMECQSLFGLNHHILADPRLEGGAAAAPEELDLA